MTKSRPALELDRKRNVWLHIIKICKIKCFKWPITDNFKWMDGYDQEKLKWIDEIDPSTYPQLLP